MTDVVRHRLSVVVRFVDHFLGRAVPDELPVRIALDGAGPRVRPVLAPGGASVRQPDGTYRFVDLPDGLHHVLWTPPPGRPAGASAAWSAWGGPADAPVAPIVVMLPLADPLELVARDLWPSAAAVVPSGVTAVRGKLRGPAAAGRRVEIAPSGGSATRYTRADALGEFLFLLPVVPAPTGGLVSLDIAVSPGSVTGGEVLAPVPAAFAGSTFGVPPGREARVTFTVT